jgi:2-methylcitrate dehydratase PrpD
MTMKAIELVGKFVATLAFEEIPSPVVLKAKRSMMDCLGVSLAASQEPCLDILRSFIRTMGGHPHSSLLGNDFRTSPAWASLYNGTMAHALDFDDGSGLHIPLHPTAPVLPGVVALGESVGASGKSVLEAYIAGVEVECKLARGCSRKSYDLGWHATGVFGTMGAAVGSAKLLRLEPHQVNTALGIALSLAGGSRQNFGTMVKPLHAGMAAMHGVVSALLAKDGYTASDGALDGFAGFSKLFDGEHLVEECSSLGTEYNYLTSYRRHPLKENSVWSSCWPRPVSLERCN